LTAAFAAWHEFYVAAAGPGAVLLGLLGMIVVLFLIVGTQTAWNLLLAGRFDVTAWGVRRTEHPEDD
jgi:hypothetical protein